MNALVANQAALELEDQEEELVLAEEKPWVLTKLRPRHKDVCALIAQGVPNVQVAQITGYTPTYICMLMRQPVCVAYVNQLNESVGAQLEMMYGKVVNVIGDALQVGTVGEKLKAARLHGELTKRIGARDVSPPSSESSEERLYRLSGRLIGLLERGQAVASNGRMVDGTCTEVPGSAVVRGPDLRLADQADEAHGDGQESEGN